MGRYQWVFGGRPVAWISRLTGSCLAWGRAKAEAIRDSFHVHRHMLKYRSESGYLTLPDPTWLP